MTSQLLSYLRRHVPSDERTVNRLFVSAFIESNGMGPHNLYFLLSMLSSRKMLIMRLFQKVEKHIRDEYGEKIIVETLVKLFEFVISPADRIVTGAVYTPKGCRETILQKVLGDKIVRELSGISGIADISCGCGGFLMDAAQWIHP